MRLSRGLVLVKSWLLGINHGLTPSSAAQSPPPPQQRDGPRHIQRLVALLVCSAGMAVWSAGPTPGHLGHSPKTWAMQRWPTQHWGWK